MTRHEETRVMPYTPVQMLEMIADIEKYPEFLPWCKGARIRNRQSKGDLEIVEADLIIAFLAFREKFGSNVTIDQSSQTIDVQYLDGPFYNLTNYWKFKPHDNGCEVNFFVEFEFKSRVLEAVIGKVFDQAMRKIIHAFEVRAKELYG